MREKNMKKQIVKWFCGLLTGVMLLTTVGPVSEFNAKVAGVPNVASASEFDASILKVQKPSVTMINYTSVNLEWGKYSNDDDYLINHRVDLKNFIIKYSTSKSMKNAKKVVIDIEDCSDYNDNDKLLGYSWEINKLKKGKTYYFTIQAFYDCSYGNALEDEYEELTNQYGPVSDTVSVTLKETKSFIKDTMKTAFEDWRKENHKADKYRYIDVNGDKYKDLVLLKNKRIRILLYEPKNGEVDRINANYEKRNYLDIKKHRLVSQSKSGDCYQVMLLNNKKNTFMFEFIDGYYQVFYPYNTSKSSYPISKSKYEKLVKKYNNKKYMKKQNIGFSWKKYSKASVLKDIG